MLTAAVINEENVDESPAEASGKTERLRPTSSHYLFYENKLAEDLRSMK